jgi:serine/threonine-protein kinase
VALLLAAFAAAGYYVYRQIDERLEESAPVRVPNVEGIVEEKAVERIEAAGFTANVERRADEEFRAGIVIDQEPEAGTDLPKGETVTIIVSTGVPKVEVPRVAGLQLDEATQALSEAGLKWDVRQVFSDRVEAGIVISQNPKPGEQADKGSVVELRVSKGENLIEVPNVVGQDEATATQILQDAGFEVSSVPVNSSEVEAGFVVAQNPLGGRAAKGSTVEIQVSQGPELVGVPGVIGLAEDEAIAALQGAGFGVDVSDLLANVPEEDGIVLNQDPPEGSQVEPGGTVTIYVGRFSGDTEPPPPDDGTTTTSG